MSLAHFVPIAALAAASLFTGLVVVFVLRAQRLNRADRCGVCGHQLGMEQRFRFHGRAVCSRCSQRVRLITVPRPLRIGILLAIWSLGVLGLVALIQRRDSAALVWGPVFGGVVLSALIAGALPPLTQAVDRTAVTLRRLHALLEAERGQKEN